jgi:pimeloyl-ACP methyl ester carboxylesterase
MSSLSKDRNKPRLCQIESAIDKEEALIFINGFLTEHEKYPQDNEVLWKGIRQAGWRGSMYHLRWDASSPAYFTLSAILLGVGAILHWEIHESKAKEVGLKYTYPIFLALTEKKVSIIGFSLGARIAYYTMRAWPDSDKRLKDIVLLGGAIRRGASKNWSDHVEKISGKLINIYNENDLVLAYLFKTVALNRSPSGIKPIKEFHPKIENLNATHLINSSEHSCSSYLTHLGMILENKLDWKL